MQVSAGSLVDLDPFDTSNPKHHALSCLQFLNAAVVRLGSEVPFTLDSMSQKLFTSLTATVLITAFGVSSSSHAEQPVSDRAVAGSKTAVTPVSGSASGTSSVTTASNPASAGLNPSQGNTQSDLDSTKVPGQDRSALADVKKVGERQSQITPLVDATAIARVYVHQMSGRSAATLYVRNIPVLTFLGDRLTRQTTGTSASQPQTSSFQALAAGNSLSDKALDGKLSGSSQSTAGATAPTNSEAPNADQPSDRKVGTGSSTIQNAKDPLWRATELAAKLNQFSRDQVDANKITVKWSDAQGQYVIKFDNNPLITFNSDTILPDTTRNRETDALQATNRLRRLLGNAPPLSGISGGQPLEFQELALGPVRFRINGMASWYGPGFHGALTANGEVYNQNALTAAHPNLAFGTRVRVTNLDNGRSVVVRINDRGPFVGNRVIDLSAGAAQVIGLLNSGVAPVRLEILGN